MGKVNVELTTSVELTTQTAPQYSCIAHGGCDNCPECRRYSLCPSCKNCHLCHPSRAPHGPPFYSVVPPGEPPSGEPPAPPQSGWPPVSLPPICFVKPTIDYVPQTYRHTRFPFLKGLVEAVFVGASTGAMIALCVGFLGVFGCLIFTGGKHGEEFATWVVTHVHWFILGFTSLATILYLGSSDY